MAESTDKQLAEFAATFRADPYGFVMAAYPWGEPTLPDGTINPLRNKRGPEPWQERLLRKIGAHITENDARAALGLSLLVFRSARASGHGVGKSAFVAWINQFFMATRGRTRGVTTANTQHQLETKTWPELAVWHRLFLFKHWFEWTATSYYFRMSPDDQRKNYMINAATVSKDNTEAFAGLHNEQGTVVIIFDEASGIEPKIWEVAQGATTDGECFFLVFGNPSQATGMFADCFDKHQDLYDCEHIDSRSVSMTNPSALADIIQLYGADSDEAKIRVYGQFPSQSYNEFISREVVQEAQQRTLVPDPQAALIMAIDVARFGRDESVIGWRQGRDARSRKQLVFNGLNAVKLSEIIIEQYNITKPDAIVIEGTGPGAGVIDILRETYHLRIVEVHPGALANEQKFYYRKRDELWALCRDWLVKEGCIGEDPILAQQLYTIQYTLDRFEQKIKLEAKEAMKDRTGLSSPDRGDTLVLTFAIKLPRRDANLNLKRFGDRNQAMTEYNEFEYGAG